jgi:hypothetical protein
VAKIKLDDNLFDRVKKVSEIAGYASPEEFIIHMIEKELAQLEQPGDDQQVIDRLKGLGYLE